jgi:hypothetical protein
MSVDKQNVSMDSPDSKEANLIEQLNAAKQLYHEKHHVYKMHHKSVDEEVKNLKVILVKALNAAHAARLSCAAAETLCHEMQNNLEIAHKKQEIQRVELYASYDRVEELENKIKKKPQEIRLGEQDIPSKSSLGADQD